MIQLFSSKRLNEIPLDGWTDIFCFEIKWNKLNLEEWKEDRLQKKKKIQSGGKKSLRKWK